MSNTRPYLVTFQGRQELVEAISQEQAISIVVAPHVSGVKAATAGEVNAYWKAKTSLNIEEWPISAPRLDDVSITAHELQQAGSDADGPDTDSAGAGGSYANADAEQK